MAQIHITSAVSVLPLTMDDLRCDYKALVASSRKRKFTSFAEYYAFRVNCETDRFTFDIKEVAFYVSKKEAEDAVICNLGNIDENGKYPYAAILSVVDGAIFAREKATISDVAIYKYNPQMRMYTLVSSSSEEYQTKSIYKLMNKAIRSLSQSSV